jgi:ketosteroid isomerase-like protein
MGPVAIVRRYFAACEARDLAGASTLFAPDFTSITATGEEFHVSTQLANLKSFFEEYSDIELSVHTMIACDDRVVTRYTHHLTHAATGMSVDYARIVIHTIRDDRIVESAGVSDSLALAQAKTAIAAQSRRPTHH